MIDKKQMAEEEIKLNFITHVITDKLSGWMFFDYAS